MKLIAVIAMLNSALFMFEHTPMTPFWWLEGVLSVCVTIIFIAFFRVVPK